jgi:hypothetical protein
MERYNPPPRRSGGIGRRSGLKIRRANTCVGSSPTSGTMHFKGLGAGLVPFLLDNEPFRFMAIRAGAAARLLVVPMVNVLAAGIALTVRATSAGPAIALGPKRTVAGHA